MLDLHRIVWWAHLPLALAWTAWLGYGKISHVLLGSANIFLRSLAPPKGAIAGSTLNGPAPTDRDGAGPRARARTCFETYF